MEVYQFFLIVGLLLRVLINTSREPDHPNQILKVLSGGFLSASVILVLIFIVQHLLGE